MGKKTILKNKSIRELLLTLNTSVFSKQNKQIKLSVCENCPPYTKKNHHLKIPKKNNILQPFLKGNSSVPKSCKKAMKFMIRCVVCTSKYPQLTTLQLKKDPQKVEDIRKTALKKRKRKLDRSLTTF